MTAAPNTVAGASDTTSTTSGPSMIKIKRATASMRGLSHRRLLAKATVSWCTASTTLKEPRFFAGTNASGGFTAFGTATMLGAIASGVGASLLVVSNALRFWKMREESSPHSGGAAVYGTGKVGLAHGH